MSSNYEEVMCMYLRFFLSTEDNETKQLKMMSNEVVPIFGDSYCKVAS
jgi:hypothetical protein